MSHDSEDLELRRRRIAFRARHRGIKEMDLILGRYVDETLDSLDANGIAMLEALIEVPDRDLYGWIAGSTPVPAEHDNAVMAGLRALTFVTTDYNGGA